MGKSCGVLAEVQERLSRRSLDEIRRLRERTIRIMIPVKDIILLCGYKTNMAISVHVGKIRVGAIKILCISLWGN